MQIESKSFFILALIGSIILFLAIIVTILLLLIEKKEGWNQYDSYILSLFWSPSSCYSKKENKEECFNRLDELGINYSFIIHGLWPTYASGEEIEPCNEDEDDQIEVSFDKEYEKNLSKNWPGLYSSDHKMWNHEYNKHGYCYIKRLKKNVKKDYKKYFEQTLKLFGDYQYLFDVIFPDTPRGLQTVSKDKFKEFLEESRFKLKSSDYSLQCVENKENNSMVLSEIWFKYDFDFNPIKDIRITENCPERFDIYFRDENRKPVWEKYDFYVLTVLWNPSYCREEGKECYKKLKEKELNIFRVHGLWPSYMNGVFPQWCNLDKNIEVNNYTQEMEDYWINIYKNNNKEFWEHEYNKHGYCLNQRMDVPVENYTYYFQETLRLYKKYELFNLIHELYPGLFPGVNKFTRQNFEKQLSYKYGNGSFAFTCLKINSEYYLFEVRLKLNIFLNFTTTKGRTTFDCPAEFNVELLEVEGPQKQAIDFDKAYDMYFFTILWLGTTCHQKGPQCYDRIKNVPKNIFTVHGLWPNLRNGTLPDWCNGKNDIEIDIKDNSLKKFVDKYWVSGYHTNEYFWGHEYNKHGYCYNQRKGYDVNNYEIYFNKVKDMFIDNNFENLFLDYFKKEDIKIEAGDMAINRTKFEKLFEEKGFSKDMYLIVCTNITVINETFYNPHISEIRIRYDLDFKLLRNATDKSEFDCPEIFYAQFLGESE